MRILLNNNFNKVVGYRINLQSYKAFLKNKNKHIERQILRKHSHPIQNRLKENKSSWNKPKQDHNKLLQRNLTL